MNIRAVRFPSTRFQSLSSFRSISPASLSAFALASLALLGGCGDNPIKEASAAISITGTLHGGQQPVAGASIQLYAAGTTGDGSPATPLMVTPPLPTARDNFSFNAFTCPSSNSLIYLVATGGNPGLAAGTSNPALSMLAGLGTCSGIGASTFVSVNEVTTVGTIAALYRYGSSFSTLGFGNSDASQFGTAFSSISEYTNVATGTDPGPSLPTGFYASSTEINTLADILSSCINSPGGLAGDGTACGRLFQLATHPRA